ncbi:MAG: serine hydrolase [Acidobacteria bacterium]|nr:serine hydrolase [Acidobacteriota bacterium]
MLNPLRSARRVVLPVLILSLIAPALVVAAPQDEQERVAMAWIEAFNLGVEAMATFRTANVSLVQDGWRTMFERTREQWGPLAVYGVMVPESGTVILGVESENEGRMRLNFSFDDTNKINGLGVEEPEGSALPSLELPAGDPRPANAIDAYLGALAEDDLFSGTALIADRGDVWFERAYGLASREWNVPNNVNTRFDVGSFNKDYTRLAIMQLMENDRLALTDTVGEYLPEYPNDRVRGEVTIEQLLQHRSGLGDYFTMEWLQTPMGALETNADYIDIWGPMPLQAEPGEREEYSNFGYTVLGAIVESITGQSYPDYVEEHIFAPAGMNDTGFFRTDGIEPNVAVGYTSMNRNGSPGEELRKNIYHEPVIGGPWGKSYSTARDLFRFFEAMFAGRLLSDEFNWLGAGWDGSMGLAGGGPGLSAILFIDDGIAVIVLANRDEPGAEDVARQILRGLRDS